MTKVSIPYLRRTPSGFYWEPSRKLRGCGMTATPLGRDEAKAIAKAQELNKLAAQFQAGQGPTYAPGSVAELIRRYERSTDYAQLAAKTRAGYDQHLRRIHAWAGTAHVKALDKALVAEWRDALEEKHGPYSAAATIRVLRALFSFAERRGVIEINPASKMRLAAAPERNQTWSEEQLARFVAAAKAQGVPSIGLAVEIGFWTGLRQGDILALPWSAYSEREGLLDLVQQKTGQPLALPVMPQLRAALKAAKQSGDCIVVSEATGEPFKADYFRHEFRRIADAAGLPADLRFMDLRRTLATNLGKAGATQAQIRAVTGHLSDQVVARYVRTDPTMAKAAFDKLQKHRKRTATENDPKTRRKKVRSNA